MSLTKGEPHRHSQRSRKVLHNQNSNLAGASSQQLPSPLSPPPHTHRHTVKCKRSTHQGPQTPVTQQVCERDLKDMQWWRRGPRHIYSEGPMLVASGPSTAPHCPRGPQKQAFPSLTSESNQDNQSRSLPLAQAPILPKPHLVLRQICLRPI